MNKDDSASSPTHSITSRLSVGTATSASSVGSVPEHCRSDTWVKYLPPDAAEPDLCPNDLRYKVFPIEILFMLASYTIIFYVYFSQQYYFQNVMRRNLTSYVPTNESICVNQTYVTHLTSNATYVDLQKDVNEINMVSNIISYSLSAIVSLFLGPLSDVYGRKPIILYILLGALISGIAQIFITYFNADARYYFLVSFFNGGSGGFIVLLHICFASVTDITKSVKWRTVRMGILESFVMFGKTFASLTIFFMMPYVKCVFSIPVWLMFASTTLALLYLVFLPEPLRKVQHERPPNELKSKFLRLFNGLKLYISPKCLGWNKWACLCLTTLLVAIYGMVIIGGTEILTYFVQNKPLEWKYQHIGIFSAAIALGNWLCLCGVFPVLVAMGFSNPVICLISSVFGIGTCAGMALLTKDWEMYLGKSQIRLRLLGSHTSFCNLAAALQGMTYLGFPALRSIISQTISSESMGELYYYGKSGACSNG